MTTKLAKYEWVDETGIKRPSRVIVDVTDLVGTARYAPHAAENGRILKIIPIQDLAGCKTTRYVPHGYRFVWHDFRMNSEYYAVFVAVEKKQ